MFFVYGKVRFLVSISEVFWEQFFSSEVTCILFGETSDLLVKCLHHKRKASLIISYYVKQDMIQIIQSSVNFLEIALGIELTQKQIDSLSISKGYMSESFLLCNSKIYVLLITLTSRNVAKFFSLITYNFSVVFKACCFEIKVRVHTTGFYCIFPL